MVWNTTMAAEQDRFSFKDILILIGIFLAIGVFSYFVGIRKGKISLSNEIIEKVDTLVICDTIMSYNPIYVEKIKTERVPVIVEKTDTMMVHDTMYVYLQREQLVWEDTLSRIWVSGVMPEVDSVQHFIKERIVIRDVVVPKIKKTRWGLGISAGYGVQLGRDIKASPYIGIGISYNLLSW